jgi:hypothetical protein
MGSGGNGVLQQPNTVQPPVPPAPPPPPAPKRATVGFALSIVAALIVLAQGIVRIFRGEAYTFLGSDELRGRVLSGLRLQLVGALAIIFAIVILLGAYFIYRPGKETVGGIIVLVFAGISIITGGGWLIGFILGIVGGILGLLKK